MSIGAPPEFALHIVRLAVFGLVGGVCGQGGVLILQAHALPHQLQRLQGPICVGIFVLSVFLITLTEGFGGPGDSKGKLVG